MVAHSSRKTAKAAALTAAAVALLGSVAAPAQDDESGTTNERLRACDAIADTTQKLECFNEVVKSLEDVPASAAAPPPATAAEAAAPAAAAPGSSPAQPAASAAPAAAAASAAAAPASNASPAMTRQPGAEASAAAAPPVTAPATAAAPAAAAPAASNSAPQPAAAAAPEATFGLSKSQMEQQSRQSAPAAKEELKSIEATIVEAWPTIDGRFEARLDNGQVWRETERTRWSSRLPDVGTPVVISKGWLGGYRMKIGDNNRLAAVRRTD